MNSNSINDLLPPLPSAAAAPELRIDARARPQQDNPGGRHIRAGQGAALPADFYGNYGNGIMETST
jgi:hypothetical protein